MTKQIRKEEKVGATIGMRLSNDTIRAIYCSSNGHVEYTGYLLAGYYDTEMKILELLSLGEVNVLGKFASPLQGVKHNFRHPHPDVTVAYHRDRGDAMRAAKLYVNREDYLTNARIYLPARYFYLFDGERWLWASENIPKFVEIKPPTPDRHPGLRA